MCAECDHIGVGNRGQFKSDAVRTFEHFGADFEQSSNSGEFEQPLLSWFGESKMEKFGGNLPIIHQICHNHGIHLAVCEVIYKNELGFAKYDEDGDESDDEDNDNHKLSSDLIEFKLVRTRSYYLPNRVESFELLF